MKSTLLVLGTAQDGGVPHAGCGCVTCRAAHGDERQRRRVASIALVGETGKALLVDATPDLGRQVARLAGSTERAPPAFDAILLTHGHIGHYLGLAFLGREGLGSERVPLYVTPRMLSFLRANRPWSHLITRENVTPTTVEPGLPFHFDGLEVLPFRSIHRAEDTDTLGLEVGGPRRRMLYLPDADRFPPDVVQRIRSVDVALVDGTFYDPSELPGRDLTEIPHPFVGDSVAVLTGARGEVLFTHLNHSNRLLHPDPAQRPVLPKGFGVLAEDAAFDL